MLPALSFEPEPVQGLPGPAMGPKRPKIGQKTGAGFIILSSPRFAQLGGLGDDTAPIDSVDLFGVESDRGKAN